MEIKPVSNNVYVPAESSTKKTADEQQVNTQVDRLELSQKSKELHSEVGTKNLAKIQERVNSGFYNQSSVITKVAEAIIKDLKL